MMTTVSSLSKATKGNQLHYYRMTPPPEWLEHAWNEMRGQAYYWSYKHARNRGGIGIVESINAYAITFSNVTLIEGASRQAADRYLVQHSDIEGMQPATHAAATMPPTTAPEVTT